MTGHLYRRAFVLGSAAAIAVSAACGGSGGGSATPTRAAVTAAVATPSIVAASTVSAGVATPEVVATATQRAPAPTATAAQGSGGPGPLPTAARATPTSPAPPPPPPPAEESLTIVAKDVKFVPGSLTAHAGAVLHLTLDNQDAGVPHDIIVYDASGAVVAGTSPENGPVQQTVTITLGAPQRYTFKCSVHPLTMNGAISVQ